MDNSDFKINQRNIVGMQTGGTRLQDRWFCAAGNIDVMDGYIILKSPAALGQRLEDSLETGYYTVSAKTTPGITVRFALGNWAGIEQNAYAIADTDGYASATLPLTHESGRRSFIYIHATGTDTPIYKTKLEYGDVCTLQNEPKSDLTTELLKCQRYYYPPKSYYCYGYFNGDAGEVFLPLPTEMRMKPTINVSATGVVYRDAGALAVASVDVHYLLPTGVQLFLRLANNSTYIGNVVYLEGMFELSAEL